MKKDWLIKPLPREGAREFNYERDLHDPFLMKDLSRAAERIWQAVAAGERIMIFADYDADGVPGAVVLASFFKKVNFDNYEVYLPDRHNEDHGLGLPGVDQAKRHGVGLIVTVDCGIASALAVTYANNLGLEVIITDHHLVPTTGLPPAYAVVDPKREDCVYPEKMLCGAGVAFKLVQGLIKMMAVKPVAAFAKEIEARQKFSVSLLLGGWEKWLLDLVAIATVADMVPLTGENRALAHFGLKVLRKSPRPGLQQLCRELRIYQEYLTEDDIAFSIGPRLNSASRMAHASEAFELLLTSNPALAAALAKKLEQNNEARRGEVDKILSHDSLTVGELAPLVVVGHESWSLGVLGLAASRLVEQFNRPAFVWGKNGNGLVKGSCRSDGTVNVVELMRAAGGEEFFSNVGGHAQAGGFSLPFERLPELGPRLMRAFSTTARTVMEPALCLEAELALEQVTVAFYDELVRLGPFGLDNAKPVFLFSDLTVVAVKKFGSAKNHLELTFKTDSGRAVKAISFFNLFPALNLAAGSRIDLAATVEKSHFRLPPELRLRIVDLRKAD